MSRFLRTFAVGKEYSSVRHLWSWSRDKKKEQLSLLLLPVGVKVIVRYNVVPYFPLPCSHRGNLISAHSLLKVSFAHASLV